MFSEFDNTTSALRVSAVVRVLTIPRLGLRHRLGLITIPALRASEGATKSVFQTSEGATSSNLRATRGFVLNVGTHGLCVLILEFQPFARTHEPCVPTIQGEYSYDTIPTLRRGYFKGRGGKSETLIAGILLPVAVGLKLLTVKRHKAATGVLDIGKAVVLFVLTYFPMVIHTFNRIGLVVVGGIPYGLLVLHAPVGFELTETDKVVATPWLVDKLARTLVEKHLSLRGEAGGGIGTFLSHIDRRSSGACTHLIDETFKGISQRVGSTAHYAFCLHKQNVGITENGVVVCLSHFPHTVVLFAGRVFVKACAFSAVEQCSSVSN